MISASILKAADQAARWHEEERRKGSKGEPYVNHLLEVTALVAEAEPDNTDAIEDAEIKREEIAEKFGQTVAVIAEECSDDLGLDKWVRRQLQIDTAAQKSRDAKLVKIGTRPATFAR
jgi:(p)ppGpp synthase/HD superfamily hydrolase